MLRSMLIVPMAVCLLPACPREAESFRRAVNPPELPADTIPENLDYAADLQVDLSDMAKLPIGVLYRDLRVGDGPEVGEGDSVLVHYRGWLPNAVLVDSAEAGVRIGAGDGLPGIEAALPGMKVGGLRKLVLSPGLAFGVEGSFGVPPNSVVVYDVELRAKIP
ncbi:MAG: FKBP-type peptidyl-prolyl cis-trans isomerase [Gemmatimonadales bacterium]